MSLPPTKPLDHAIKPAKQGARRHYGSHPYFTKRAWNVVQAYIEHFSLPGDAVLDPYGGSGVTAVESLVLRRKAIYVDISLWACFLARQTAIAPVDIPRLRDAFAGVEDRCRSQLQEFERTPDEELQRRPVHHWYPRDIPLPGNADVSLVEELFTSKMLHGLACLRAAIMECRDHQLRDLLLMAFSATLARINRTFLSTTNRRESRGGSAIFSIYRYKVAKKTVELPLWEQFKTRVGRLLEAKAETNQLIGDFYREGETAVFQQGSATDLFDFIKPGSVDYIYTDPPYGGHIAYLDLSTMWAAWLGFDIKPEDRSKEVIEGGSLKKSRDDYQKLLAASLAQMHETLKSGSWMSIVYAHRDASYWHGLVDACRAAGFRYVNTVCQPVGVVWSMHKKKNPLTVLSGELVLNFQKNGRVVSAPTGVSDQDSAGVVRACCENEIINGIGAATETLHHVLIPRLLETGLLSKFGKEYGDLPSLLKQFFDFDRETERWQLRDDAKPIAYPSKKKLARYYIARFLSKQEREGKTATQAEIQRHVNSRVNTENSLSRDEVGALLNKIGCSLDGRHWRPISSSGQRELFLSE